MAGATTPNSHGAMNANSGPSRPTISGAVVATGTRVLDKRRLEYMGYDSPVSAAVVATDTRVLDKRRLDELVAEVDPLEQLDDEVEEMLMQIADDFIDNVVSASCQLAKHRKSSTVEAKDVQLHLERSWNMWVPGFGSTDDSNKPVKKSAASEAHKQRLALIKKTMKKF